MCLHACKNPSAQPEEETLRSPGKEASIQKRNIGRGQNGEAESGSFGFGLVLCKVWHHKEKEKKEELGEGTLGLSRYVGEYQ